MNDAERSLWSGRQAEQRWSDARMGNAAEVYGWLRANGVDELIPHNPTITVGGGQLSFTAYEWDGPPGWDYNRVKRKKEQDVALHVERTVPLVRPVTPRLRQLAAELADDELCRFRLVEVS